MIYGYLHEGSGLGNQLHRYVATRVLALDKGFDYGMVTTRDYSGKGVGFKGHFFHEQPNIVPKGDWNTWTEKKVIENGVDIRGYDPEINFVGDNTIIEGEFQDARYFAHRMKEINEWLKADPLEVPDDLLMVGFRGGEYKAFEHLFLTKEYWDTAFEKARDLGHFTGIQVHTDDPETARTIFPAEPIADMAINWRAMRNAKAAVIANSSFYILPRLLKHWEDPDAITIAPRYWARHNTGVWALPQNYYSQFRYV